jgi:hypothetical protein
MWNKFIDFLETYHRQLHLIGGILVILSTYIQYTDVWFKIVILLSVALSKEIFDILKNWNIKVFDIVDVLFTVIPGLITLLLIEYYDII